MRSVLWSDWWCILCRYPWAVFTSSCQKHVSHPLTCFGSRLSVLALLCFLPPPRLFGVVKANFFSGAHLRSPHSLSPPSGVLFILLIVFFHGVFEIAPCMNFFENYSVFTSQFFPPRICSPRPWRPSHCLNVLCIEPAVGRGAWSWCPLINPIFFPLICNKAVTNFTAWALCGGPAYLPLAHRNKKAINPLGAITTMKRRAYCSYF